MKRGLILALILVSLLCLSLVSASWFSDFFKKFTGKAVSSKLTEQWASSAEATGYYNDNWKTEFSIGASDGSCTSWKAKSAWCKKALSSSDPVTLTFDKSVYSSKISVYFTGVSSGDFAINKVELVKDDGSSETIWQGTNSNCNLDISFSTKSYLAKKVRITTKSGYWGCVDAVKLIGYEEVCSESWTCTDWSACVDGQQTRTCTDANNCGTTTNKPATSQSCICTENWTCSEWSACSNNLQTRTCTDSNNCGTTLNKPTTSQGCCVPNCVGKECGNDGCGGICGVCDIGKSCVNNKCIETCPDNDNDGYSSVGGLCGLIDCNDANANINPGKNETCGNSIDDDCDGTIDEGCNCISEATRVCGTTDIGECKKGNQTCINSTWGNCIGNIEPLEEICDNKDNDCDGSIDENLVRTCGTSDIGECRLGIEMCSAGKWIGCNSVEPVLEICKNGKDDDCDNETDEQDCGLECNGCVYNQTCLKIGFRITINNLAKYCDSDSLIKEQKEDNESCDNGFECKSNQCSDNICVGLVKEIREQTSLLWRIWCALIHPVSKENRCICITGDETKSSDTYIQCMA